jgi:argininosuccinate lyase|tara:strand:- start:4424 stop:5791 length:1368 start_codon:yes stop_codon:yes gene_type:complete
MPKQSIRTRKNTALAYSASISFDKRLYNHDINGSIAHANMLASVNIISKNDAKKIVSGLENIRKEIKDNVFPWNTDLEDIHMNIEDRLHGIIGETAGKLHTGRSRNDQIATDLRLYLKTEIPFINTAIRVLQQSLLSLAESNIDTLLPGYTHLQRAQPISLAHHYLAYFEMFDRDVARYRDCLKRTDILPLGSGALAGVPYNLDRNLVAQTLGFASVSKNSIDAVSDRDFIAEFQACSSICALHISRLAEELVLWSSSEFGYLSLNDAYVTGSSIMPQKRNPDYAELARAKSGRIFGNLTSILTILKGLPLAYNRDLQEDKEGLFDTIDTMIPTLEVLAGLLGTMTIRKEQMRANVADFSLLATDLADYLVSKGVPFREAHSIVVEISEYAQSSNLTLEEIDPKTYQKFSVHFPENYQGFTPETSVSSRNLTGGTAIPQIKKAISDCKARLGKVT